MNARRARKLIREGLAEMQGRLLTAQKDIRDYNSCIDHMIAGGSPCDWCEDQQECQLEAKGHGCDLWMLKYREADNA